MAATAPKLKERELVITRLYDVPRTTMFKVWTDPRHIAQWWGPRDYPATEMKLDVRPGGQWRGCLTHESGEELWLGGVYREIAPPERLVFTFAWEEEGERGLETLVTVTFADQGGKTLMTFRHAPFQSDAERDSHFGGWSSVFDRLEEHLSKQSGEAAAPPAAQSELVVTRTFAAPRELVFRCWTEPQHMARWWGPHGFTNPVCQMDVRPGGAIHIVMRGPDGTDYPMGGTFHEIAPPERLVITSTVDDPNGRRLFEIHNIITFAQHGDRTTVTVRARIIKALPEARGMLAGMQPGWTQSLERLEALAKQMQA